MDTITRFQSRGARGVPSTYQVDVHARWCKLRWSKSVTFQRHFMTFLKCLMFFSQQSILWIGLRTYGVEIMLKPWLVTPNTRSFSPWVFGSLQFPESPSRLSPLLRRLSWLSASSASKRLPAFRWRQRTTAELATGLDMCCCCYNMNH